MQATAERKEEKTTIASIAISETLLERVDVARHAEQRSRAAMFRVLITEALDARNARKKSNRN